MIMRYEPEWLDQLVDDALPDDGLTTWVPGGDFESSSLVRVPRFPHEVEESTNRSLSLDAVRNEHQSGQIAVAADIPLTDLSATIEDLQAESGAEIPSENVTVRFVEYVPVVRSEAEHDWAARVEDVVGEGVSGSRAPDLVGDPLIDDETVDVPAYRAQPLWLTVDVPEDTPAETYTGQVHVDCEEFSSATFDLTINVHDVTLSDPVDYDFHLDLWIQPNSVAAEHDVEPWSEAHWTLLESYLEDMATRSQSVILTTIIEEPWKHGASRYDSMVTWHRGDDGWRFDYETFDRFVETALDCGVGPEIAAYSMLAFNKPERLTYFENGKRVVEETTAGSEQWVDCWTAFLEDFSSHLREQGWLEQTMIAIDEREETAVEAVEDLLEATVPELADRIQIAGSLDAAGYAYDFSSNHSHIPLDEELVAERRAAGKRTTFYTCGLPDHPNTLSFSPAIETRMLPWIAAEGEIDGYLKWAHNNWPHDARENPSYKFPQGDEYMVYPGSDGPASSIRWELLREGIEDYELVAMLRNRDEESLALDVALDLATREFDGREKSLSDIPRARSLVVNSLEESQ